MRRLKGPGAQGSKFPAGSTPLLPSTSPKLCDFVLNTTVSTFSLDEMQALPPLSKAVSVTRNSHVDNKGAYLCILGSSPNIHRTVMFIFVRDNWVSGMTDALLVVDFNLLTVRASGTMRTVWDFLVN